MALFSIKYCCGQVFENPDPLKIDKINIKSIKNILFHRYENLKDYCDYFEDNYLTNL